ncbi:MAG: hypothetical protein AAGH79_11755 [Bacteroidota bacterium]
MKQILLLLCFFAGLHSILAQEGIVVDGDLPEAEFHVAINPIDTNHIIVATMHGREVLEGNNLRVHYTFDQGLTWETSTFQGEHPYFNDGGDPVVSFDAAGNAYLVQISFGSDINTIISKSTDGGATWVLGGEVDISATDKPWLAVDRFEDSPYQNNIYVPVVDNLQGPTLCTFDADLNQTNKVLAGSFLEHLPGITVRKDGEVFMSMVGSNDPQEVFIAQYTGGGVELVHKTVVTTFPNFLLGAPAVSNRFQPTVSVAVDNSGGPYDGRLYLTFTATESISPPIFDVFLTYSDDGGLSWTEPTPVHPDTPMGTQQFYSSIFVNDQGVVLLDWYDRRNYPTTDLNTDFYLGISKDGGQNFTNVQLNSISMDFLYTLASGNGFGIGEYHQMVATDHTAIAFWADGRTNDEDLNIYMAKVNLDSPISSIQELGPIYTGISISSPYPTPAREEIYVDLQIDKTARMQVLLLDVQGRILNTTNWRHYAPGNYTEYLTLPLSAGTYIVQVQLQKGFFKSFTVTK